MTLAGLRRSSCARSSARSRWTRRSAASTPSRVHNDANKLQIKAAVEELFKVTVLQRQRPDHEAQGEVAAASAAAASRAAPRRGSKAVVTVAAGDKIEFFEGV